MEIVKSQQLSATSHTIVPNETEAAIISSIIDRTRLSVGWNRLQQGREVDGRYISGEQDAAILTWYEILTDSGVPPIKWNDCYRKAQKRKRELLAQGKESGIVLPNDLVVEYQKEDIDESHLLPENAASACQRCFGTNKEEMPDGSVKETCSHLPLSDVELEERRQAKQKSIEFMRDAMKKVGRPKSAPAKPTFVNIIMECDYCHRRVDNDGVMWTDGDECGTLLLDDQTCRGRLYEYKRVGSPFN